MALIVESSRVNYTNFQFADKNQTSLDIRTLVWFHKTHSAMRRDILLAILLAVITAAVFSPVLTSEFLEVDDKPNIVDNVHVHALTADNVKWMFTDTSLMRRYVPFSWLTWATTAQLFGVKSFVFHLEGLLLHTANAILVFWLLRKLLARAAEKTAATSIEICAAIAALLWAIHPMRTEVIGWANCQMYSQTLLFALLALWLYFRAVEEARTTNTVPIRSGKLWLSVFCLGISLLTYPTLIGFVVVLVILDIYFLRRLSSSPRDWFKQKGILVEKIPFVLVTLGAAAVTLWARKNMSAYWAGTVDMTHFTWGHRIAQAFYIWAYYLWRPFWPIDLSPFYVRLISFEPLEPIFVISGVAVVGGTIIFFLKRNRWPLLFAVWICHLALLVPMLGLTEHPHYSSDRYNHIEAILFAVVIGYGLLRFWPTYRAQAITASVVTAVICGALSFEQTHLWKNKIVYTQEMIARVLRSGDKEASGWCAMEYNRLGDFFVEAGNTEEAIKSYSSALQLEPRLPTPRDNLTALCCKPAHTERAMTYLEAVLRTEPTNVLARCMLAAALRSHGQFEPALAQIRRVLESEPDNSDANKFYGLILAETEQCEKAMPYLQKAAQLASNSPQTQYEIGAAFLTCDRPNDAIQLFTRAIQLMPRFAAAHVRLGTVLAMSDRLNEGLPHLQEAARLQPNAPEILVPLAMALAEAGNKDEARQTFDRATQLAQNAGNEEMVARIRSQAKILDSVQSAHR